MSPRATTGHYDGLEVVPPGLEVPQSNYPELYQTPPEVVPHRDDKYPFDVSEANLKQQFHADAQVVQVLAARRRRKRRLIILGVSLAAVLIIAIAVAVPVSLLSRPKASAAESIATASTTSATSASTTASIVFSSAPSATSIVNADKSLHGAYNGSGMVVVGTLNHNHNNRLIYQHASGQIRSSVLGDTWQEGGNQGIVVDLNDQNAARNGTPTAADDVPTDNDANGEMHVFYANKDGVLCDLISSGTTISWKPGNLSRSNFKVLDSPTAQISFLWASDWAQGKSTGSPGANGGFRIYWSGDDDRVHEASQPTGADNWTESWVFDDSISSGGFDAFVMNSVDYLWATARKTSKLTYLWRDYNLNGTNSTDHPRGTWTSGPASSTVIRNGSAVSYGGSSLLYYQSTLNEVHAIYTNGTPGTYLWGQDFQVGASVATPGTKIKGQSLYNSLVEAAQIRIYYQELGSTITEWVRGVEGGSWTRSDVAVAQ